MSGWTHPFCERCWGSLYGERVPTTIVEEVRVEEQCCRCQHVTRSGIYVRADPNTLPCAGVHIEIPA